MARTISGPISPEQVRAFLRAVRGQEGVFAVELINEDLDGGASVNELFNGKLGYVLHAIALAPGEFRIRFGCQSEGTAGDGAEWLVRFDERGGVAAAVAETCWVSELPTNNL